MVKDININLLSLNGLDIWTSGVSTKSSDYEVKVSVSTTDKDGKPKSPRVSIYFRNNAYSEVKGYNFTLVSSFTKSKQRDSVIFMMCLNPNEQTLKLSKNDRKEGKPYAAVQFSPLKEDVDAWMNFVGEYKLQAGSDGIFYITKEA